MEVSAALGWRLLHPLAPLGDHTLDCSTRVVSGGELARAHAYAACACVRACTVLFFIASPGFSTCSDVFGRVPCPADPWFRNFF